MAQIEFEPKGDQNNQADENPKDVAQSFVRALRDLDKAFPLGQETLNLLGHLEETLEDIAWLEHTPSRPRDGQSRTPRLNTEYPKEIHDARGNRWHGVYHPKKPKEPNPPAIILKLIYAPVLLDPKETAAWRLAADLPFDAQPATELVLQRTTIGPGGKKIISETKDPKAIRDFENR